MRLAGAAGLVAGPLLERDRELQVLYETLDEALGGVGRFVMVEGGAGIGKSRLLGMVCERARSGGVRVLEARASELELEFPFGVALQLFEATVGGLAPRERRALLRGAAALAAPLFDVVGAVGTAPVADRGFSLLHGLFWLTAGLAEGGPLLIAVDDAHWGDTSSLRFLHYLVHRVEDLPVTVVVAARPGETGEQRDLLLALATNPGASILRPQPLSTDGTTRLTQLVFADPDAAFIDRCAQLTGGNPFLLHELLHSLAAEGTPPDAATATRIAAYDVAPESIVRAAVLRLARLPAAATALARAVAVLGDDARADRAGALAALDVDATAMAIDALGAAGMIDSVEPLTFVHPLISAGVAAEIPPAERAAGHRRAAQLLHAEGVGVERLAAHLLRASRRGDTFTVEVLRSAAARAISRGAPEPAVAYLRRALDEPPPPPALPEVMIELGDALAAVGGSGAAVHFESALELLEEPERTGEVRWKLGRVLYAHGRHAESVVEFERARDDFADHDPALARRLGFAALTATLVTQSVPDVYPGSARTHVDALIAESEATPLEADELAPLVGLAGIVGEPRETVLKLADDALADGTLITNVATDQGHAVTMVAIGLLYADALVRSERMLDGALEQARRRGALLAVATLSYARAWPLYFRGRLSEAVADAEQARDARRFGWQMYPVAAASVLAHALIELGDLDSARAALDGEDPAGRGAEWTMLLAARGRLLLAQHDPQGALEVLEESGRMLAQVGIPTRPSLWRSRAALAAAALGDHTRAEHLIADELADARRTGAPRQIGMALRTAGLLAGGARGVELLREAVDTLEHSDARLELARALIDFGAAQRRIGERANSRESLRRGLELAHGFGAGPLVSQAQSELKATGARPRRLVQTGAASLTASERRVAELAAGGLTNRQIAQSLFVTAKAVEFHLRHVYQKLDIDGRRQIAAALRRGDPDASPQSQAPSDRPPSPGPGQE